MSQSSSAAVTLRDENFESQPSTLVASPQPAARNFSRPGVPLFKHNAAISALQGAPNTQDTSPELVSTHTLSQTSLERSAAEPRSTMSQSDSVFSGNHPRNPSFSTASQSASDNSRSSEALQAPAKKKAKDFLNFLTIKEPSTKALEEFAAQQQRELKQRGLTRPFGISDSKLPANVPKVNSKWDGLPDDKRDLILATEKQKKKKKKDKTIDQRRLNISTGNQEEASHARYYKPNFVPPGQHKSRPSTGSANMNVTSSSKSESYKSCDPKVRGPRTRPLSVPSLAESGHVSGSTDGSLASPSHYARFNRSNDEGLIQSDSDMLSSSEDFMPQTPCTPPPSSSNGRRRSVPIIVPLTSPLEDGMHNVAPLRPFLTEIKEFEPRAAATRPATSVSVRSTANAGSAFLAGEAWELDVSDENTDEEYTPRKVNSTDSQTNLLRRPLSVTATAERESSFAGSAASPEPGNAKHFRTYHVRGNSEGSNRSIAESVAQVPKDRLGLGIKVKREDTFRERTLDIRPPSPPEDLSMQSKNKFRRSLLGKN